MTTEEAEVKDMDEWNHTNATSETLSSSIRIETMELHHIPHIIPIFDDAFGSKKMFFCIPINESEKEMTERYKKYPPEKIILGAVAVDSETDRIVGAVQMTRHGLPMYPEGFHSCKRNEMYIETLAVSRLARGKGVGTLLLKWCEATARSDNSIDFLYLSVINGNRAKSLYERFGFVDDSEGDCVDEFCAVAIVCCCFGRPYGCCDPAWGATDMVKELRVKAE